MVNWLKYMYNELIVKNNNISINYNKSMLPHNDVILSTPTSNFICNSCNKIFNTKSHLTQHKKKKNPCFAANLITNFVENTIEPNSLVIVNDKPFNDFMVKYQALIKQNSSINNSICEYQTKNKELSAENLKYRLMIKSISHIIYPKKDVELDNLALDEIIGLPLKNKHKQLKLDKMSPDSITYISPYLNVEL